MKINYKKLMLKNGLRLFMILLLSVLYVVYYTNKIMNNLKMTQYLFDFA